MCTTLPKEANTSRSQATETKLSVNDPQFAHQITQAHPYPLDNPLADIIRKDPVATHSRVTPDQAAPIAAIATRRPTWKVEINLISDLESGGSMSYAKDATS